MFTEKPLWKATRMSLVLIALSGPVSAQRNGNRASNATLVPMGTNSLAAATRTLSATMATQAGRNETIELEVGEQRVLSSEGVQSYSEGTKGVVDIRLTKDASQFVVVGLREGTSTLLFLLSAVTLGTIVASIANAVDASPWYWVGAALFGLALPTLQLLEIIRRRAKMITRALPPAIEIAAMCMGAGLDFPGSLRMHAERNSPKPSDLGREFAVILEHLDFGHTRKEALKHFAERVPSTRAPEAQQNTARGRDRRACYPVELGQYH